MLEKASRKQLETSEMTCRKAYCVQHCQFKTMELHVSVRSSDPNVASEIAQMKIEGVIIKQPLVIKEIISPPVLFILKISATLAVNVAAQLIARKLWAILKDMKETKLTINGVPIEINAQKIEHLIIISLKEKEE